MFKWMISGHRGHKSKGGKLNNGNNNWNNNNNNGVKKNLNNNKKTKPTDEIQTEDNSGFQQTDSSNEYLNSADSPNQSGAQLSSIEQSGANCHLQSSQEPPIHLQQSEQQQRFAQFQLQQRNYRNSQNNLLGNSRDTLDDSNEYTTLEQLHLQPGGHMDQNHIQRVKSVEQLSGNQSLPPSLLSSGLNGDRIEPPLLTTSSGTRPSNSLAIGSQPNLNQYSSHHDSLQLDMFSNPLPEAPGTCTLPRRSAMKEEINARYRCPSNPPTHNRLMPPPYSRHQFPENSSSLRRVYQPPPPPPPPRIVQDAKSPYKQLPQKFPATFPEPNKKQETDFHQLNQNNPSNVFSAFDKHSNDFVRQQEDPLRNIDPYPRMGTKQADKLALPSKSTEDLLNASRVPNCSLISSSNKVIQIHNYELHQTKSNPTQIDVNNKELTEVLSSDSIYPSGTPSQGRYEPIAVRTTPSAKQIEESSNLSTFRDHRRKDLGKSNGEQQTMKSVSMDIQTALTWDRHFQRNGKEAFSENQSKCFQMESQLASRDQFNSDHHLWGRSKDSSIPKRDTVHSNYFDNRNDLFICEEEDRKEMMLGRARPIPNDNKDAFWSYQKSAQEDHNDYRQKQIAFNKQETSRDGPRFGREEFSADGADTLTVKDSPTYPSLDRRSFQKFSELEIKEKKNDIVGDSSSSWMEWTQQLKAYIAWVNSQLRKRPDQLPVTDLRRDFQNGVVFADLIEIISGERISGIVRGADTPQLCRENLDRILQFMAAKRIRMTHITSKEITEGNLKSIMRVILALAAHYKPQSVREGSQSQEQEAMKQQTPLVVNTQIKSTPKKTHDIGVGPDKPLPLDKSPDKTPNLTRRNLNDHRDDDEEEEEESTDFIPLRRQPSLTNAIRPSSPNPVYENLLPKRASQNRWAYDSLRASHKFYWGGSSSPSSSRRHREKKVTSSTPQKGVNSLDDDDENMNSTLNTNSSECTSLNTSVDVDINGRPLDENIGTTSFIQKVNKPAALDFWQGLQGHEREEMKKTPEVEADSPFRYHTIHRMSGRRKLPQIPGQSCSSSNNSRVTTPLGLNSGPTSDISQCGFDDTFDRSRDASGVVRGTENGGNISDETSREPEGRSQNSSPAASVARDPLFDSWRQVFGQENIKNGLRESSLRKEGREDVSKLFTNDEEATVLRQEVIKHVLTKKALENEKEELSNHIYQKENQISELRKQLLQKEKTLHIQRIQFDETIRNIQSTKSYRPINGDSSSIRCQGREELQLVREAISALRSNFRGTDPNQHTLDTLEQAIAVLMERGVALSNATADVASKSDSRCLNGSGDTFTKVIYFTDRTVTPYMSCIGKRIGDVTLRDFKEIFDRPGLFRFHFKSQDPEYGLVKEEVINDDDILPGVDGKIIAWVQEDQE